MDELNLRERRRRGRISIRIPAEYRSKSYWQVIEARNISCIGMFAVTDKIEPPGTKLEVMFEFGGQDEKKLINTEGVVIWNRSKEAKDEQGKILPQGMGIEFVNFKPFSGKDFIENIVRKKIIEEGENA